MFDDDIKNQRAIIKAATQPGPFAKGPRYNLCRGEAEYRPDGSLCDVLTEEEGAPLYEAVPIADAEFVIAASVLWPAALDEIEQLRHRLGERTFEAGIQALPVPMLLWCPECGERHVDVDFATRVHHTHSCQSCGLTWRPAVVPTVGVQFLPGFKDEAPDGERELLALGVTNADVLANRRNGCVAPGCGMSHHCGLADLAVESGWVKLGDGWLCREHAAEVRHG